MNRAARLKTIFFIEYLTKIDVLEVILSIIYDDGFLFNFTDELVAQNIHFTFYAQNPDSLVRFLVSSLT